MSAITKKLDDEPVFNLIEQFVSTAERFSYKVLF